MFFGLREHEMRSNPCIIGVKIPFDPGIITICKMQKTRHFAKYLSTKKNEYGMLLIKSAIVESEGFPL